MVTTSDTPASPTLAATGLPAGLSSTDNGDGTAIISGTPKTKVAKTVEVDVTASSNGVLVKKQILTVSITR